MWSVQDLSWRKPACSSHSVLSSAFFNLSSMILDNTFQGIDSSMIPLLLLQDDKSPFFGSLTRFPFFQSSGTCSWSQILLRSGCIISVDVWISDFNASGGMPSGHAALPDLRDLVALLTSVFVGGLVLAPRSSVGGEMSGRTDGAGLLSVSWKCSAHLARCSSSLEMEFVFLYFTCYIWQLIWFARCCISILDFNIKKIC